MSISIKSLAHILNFLAVLILVLHNIIPHSHSFDCEGHYSYASNEKPSLGDIFVHPEMGAQHLVPLLESKSVEEVCSNCFLAAPVPPFYHKVVGIFSEIGIATYRSILSHLWKIDFFNSLYQRGPPQ